VKDLKCVVWDLDETLWDGILLEGDDLQLKPSILEILSILDSRGILLSIASRNNFDQAMEKLKAFGIEHYFLYPEIGWGAKSVSIARIQKNLNIGMDTILYIDDQPFELDEVKLAHPSVTIIQAAKYQELTKMERLTPKMVTEVSNRRRQMYLEDQKRQSAEKEFIGPSQDFLASLNMEFKISLAKEEDLLRAEELTFRTNQLNSTGIHYSYDDLKHLVNSPNHHLWVCELTDKYGSYGKIGLALVEVQEDAWCIRLILMSCRTVSRGVGTVMLSFLMKEAKSAGKLLRADFHRTDRNRHMYMAYKFTNFIETQSNENRIVFENDLTVIQEYPPYLKIVTESIYSIEGGDVI